MNLKKYLNYYHLPCKSLTECGSNKLFNCTGLNVEWLFDDDSSDEWYDSSDLKPLPFVWICSLRIYAIEKKIVKNPSIKSIANFCVTWYSSRLISSKNSAVLVAESVYDDSLYKLLICSVFVTCSICSPA